MFSLSFNFCNLCSWVVTKKLGSAARPIYVGILQACGIVVNRLYPKGRDHPNPWELNYADTTFVTLDGNPYFHYRKLNNVSIWKKFAGIGFRYSVPFGMLNLIQLDLNRGHFKVLVCIDLSPFTRAIEKPSKPRSISNHSIHCIQVNRKQ
jgi:hypothetical protein